MKRLIAILVLCLWVVPCVAKTITVDNDGPADFQSIQAAIDSSWHGDTLIVKRGTYAEQIVFNGRAITVRSEDPDDAGVVQGTVIAATSGFSVIFDFSEDASSVLQGFTIMGYGISCEGSSPTISKNVIRNCASRGIEGRNGAAPTITGNTISANALEGIYMCSGTIRGNTISQNAAGVVFCNGLIADNLISENSDEGGLYSCDGEISGNRIVGNYAATHGGGLYACGGDIHHNIIAGNRAGGDGGGLYECTKSIQNNTIVGNIAGNAGGALAQCAATVRNNIIAANEAVTAGGIYGPCSNTYNAFSGNLGGNFSGGSSSGLGDIAVVPNFAVEGYWDDNGTDDVSDDSWVNGDYHLKSQVGRWDAETRQWVTDMVTSRCIDAGSPASDWSAELWPHGRCVNLGAYGGTPQASLSQNDLGYQADLDRDTEVGPSDLKLLVEVWATEGELLAEDFDRDQAVDFNDFAIMAMSWRAAPAAATPPLPDPMAWETRPYATGPYSIAMVAATAVSTDDTGVEYYFEDYFSPEFNSGWLAFAAGQEPRWEDSGLQPETTYWYRVKARNRGNLLETGWSRQFAATTSREDFTKPTPNPMTWATEPFVASANTIRMVATAAVDENGVEYQFQCTSHPAYSSGWQDGTTYQVTDLPHGDYTFTVRARDKSPNQNTTESSSEVTVDLQPPTPDPMDWESAPEKIRIGTGSFNYHATMTAVEATDAGGAVEYFFQCTNESGFNSGWQSEREYTVHIGGAHVSVNFRVKARDASGNETGWSSTLPAL